MAARKPKTKGIPPPAAAPPAGQSQRDRFIEAAREAGVTDESLDDAVKKLVPQARQSRRTK